MKLSTLLLAFLTCAVSGWAKNVYLFSYFVGQSDGLHLAYSYDGLRWTALNDGRPMMTPTVGNDRLLRDPSIVQGEDGTFHMVWTSSWHDRIIGYASSPDLIHWSEQQAIPVMMHEPDARNSWAPELFYDEPSGLFYIFWATTIPGRHSEVAESEREKGLNHRIYYTTTRDFHQFSPTRLFFDQSFSAIDAAIVRSPIDGSLIMTIKNENPNPPEKNIRISRSSSLTGGGGGSSWSPVSAPIHGKFWAEGPAPLFVHDTLYVYYDCYMNHRYGVSRSTDNGYTWQSVDSLATFPRDIRHGTAFPVSKAILNTLLEKTNNKQ